MSIKYHHNLIYKDLKDSIENFAWDSLQTKTAIKTALACVTAVLFANAVKLPMPYWSGISTLIIMRNNVSDCFNKGWMRTGGCTIGCILALFFFGYIIQNSILFSIFIFLGMFISFYAGVRANYGYFWSYMLANMVLIGLLSYTNPYDNFPVEVAFYRAAEIFVGVISSWIFNIILWPYFTPSYSKKHETNNISNSDENIIFLEMLTHNSDYVCYRIFSHRFSFYIPSLVNAAKGGLSVLFIFWFCLWLQIPGGLLNMTIAILAVMGPQMNLMDTKHKGILRIGGCLFGAAVGLFFLLLSIESTLFNFLAIFLVIFICCYIWGGKAGVGYLGLQAGIAFLLCSAGSFTATTSFYNVIERLTGVFIAVIIIWIMNSIIWPDDFVTRLMKKICDLKNELNFYIRNNFSFAKHPKLIPDEYYKKMVIIDSANIKTILQNCEAQQDMQEEEIKSIADWIPKVKNIIFSLSDLHSIDHKVIALFEKEYPKFLSHFIKSLLFSINLKTQKNKAKLKKILDNQTLKLKEISNNFLKRETIQEQPVQLKITAVRFILSLSKINTNIFIE